MPPATATSRREPHAPGIAHRLYLIISLGLALIASVLCIRASIAAHSLSADGTYFIHQEVLISYTWAGILACISLTSITSAWVHCRSRHLHPTPVLCQSAALLLSCIASPLAIIPIAFYYESRRHDQSDADEESYHPPTRG